MNRNEFNFNIIHNATMKTFGATEPPSQAKAEASQGDRFGDGFLKFCFHCVLFDSFLQKSRLQISCVGTMFGCEISEAK